MEMRPGRPPRSHRLGWRTGPRGPDTGGLPHRDCLRAVGRDGDADDSGRISRSITAAVRKTHKEQQQKTRH